MPDDTLPRVFVIGLPMTGGAEFKRLFEANGYLWRHRQGGKLACDIAYCKATGTAPLRPWGKAVGFSGLDRTDRQHLPPIEAWREFRYLHSHFPDAYFINPHGDPADWVARRFFAQSGTTRDIAAWHRGVTEDALPELWLEDLARHREEAAQYFAGNARFIDLNMDADGIVVAIKMLSNHFDLTVPPEATPATCTPDQIREVLSHMENPKRQPAAASADPLFADHVALHCLGTKGHDGPARALSQTAVRWSDDGFTDREGAPVGMVRDANRMFLSEAEDRYERSQATLDEFIRHGGAPPVWVDMMDARFVGSQGKRNAPRGTLAYNRRTGASNLVLWPLPGYHTLAPRGAPGSYPVDDIAFADKADTCAWLGNMTGRMVPALSPDNKDLKTAYALRDRANTLSLDDDWGTLINDFMCIPRYNVVRTFHADPGFALGFVLRGEWKPLASSPVFKGLTQPEQPLTWFHQHRYVLSLSGNDTGSNFLMAAASNSVILKEEDGWELFYTDAFKAWTHYIPLEQGAVDLPDKLAWAKANPAVCAAMATSATALYDAFAAPANRKAILDRIVAGLK